MSKNNLDRYLQDVKESIADKEEAFSIKRFDVADRLSALAKMLGVKQVVLSEKYTKDWVVRDANYNGFLSKKNNVLGDVTNPDNWVKIWDGSGGSSSPKLPFQITCDGSRFYSLTHNLGTRNLITSICQGQAPYQQLLISPQCTTPDTIQYDLGGFDEVGLTYLVTVI